MKKCCFKLPAFALAFALSNAANAEFGPHKPSINGTSETLPQGNAEVGFSTLSYGVTDEFMLSIPTLPMIFAGPGQIDARYKIAINNAARVSPDASLFFHEGLVSFAAGATLGLDFGKTSGSKKGAAAYNSLDIGAKVVSLRSAYRPKSVEEEKAYVWDLGGNYLHSTIEFNHYTDSSNLFYVGATNSYGPYMGFTWGFESVHVGLVSSLPTMYIPCPYIYWRF